VLPQQRGHQRKTPVVEINRGFYSRLAPHIIKNSGMGKTAFGDDIDLRLPARDQVSTFFAAHPHSSTTTEDDALLQVMQIRFTVQ
jgi:hypothetical protein